MCVREPGIRFLLSLGGMLFWVIGVLYVVMIRVVLFLPLIPGIGGFTLAQNFLIKISTAIPEKKSFGSLWRHKTPMLSLPFLTFWAGPGLPLALRALGCPSFPVCQIKTNGGGGGGTFDQNVGFSNFEHRGC